MLRHIARRCLEQPSALQPIVQASYGALEALSCSSSWQVPLQQCQHLQQGPAWHTSSWQAGSRGISTSPSASAEPTAATEPIGNEKVQRLAEDILGLTVLESSWLTEILRKRLNLQKPAFGSMPSAPAGAASIAPSAAACPAAPAAKAEPVKEKTDFEVKLESYSAEGKIRVIKEIRAITTLGLKEAKELVEKAPVVIKSAVSKADAENIKKLIETAGGKISLL